MARVLLVLVIVLALVLALFGVQNPQTVNIQFLSFTTGYVPVYVVILISTLAGFLLASVLSLRGRIVASLRIRRQERQIADLEQQLARRSSGPVSIPTSSTVTEMTSSSRLP